MITLLMITLLAFTAYKAGSKIIQIIFYKFFLLKFVARKVAAPVLNNPMPWYQYRY